MQIEQSDVELVKEIMNRFLTTGRYEIPAGRREQVITLLTTALTEREFFTAFVAAVGKCRDDFGEDAFRKLVGSGGVDIPDDEIIANGFINLPDDVLADIVTSPGALGALDELLYGEGAFDLELGDWFLGGDAA